MTNTLRSKFLLKLCSRIEHGTLLVRLPDGEMQCFGDGEPKAEISIRDWALVDIVLQRGDIGLGEAYVEGYWDSPSVENVLAVLINNEQLSHVASRGNMLQNLIFRFTNSFIRKNNRTGSKKNIEAHYDVGNDFYRLWLDDTMTYSSALYHSDDETLKDAQHNKYDRLLSLLPDDAENILEIGCGWGGFAERAAEQNRRVNGITISPSQHAFASDRLGTKAEIELRDYRDVSKKYDSIVSIEMIEAVGEQYWPSYFQKIKESLADQGRAAIQAIIVEDDAFDRYRTQSDFIRQYIFPGGMLIPPRAINQFANEANMTVDNIHRFGVDYARTLREWLRRFNSAEADIRAQGHGSKFLRSWRYYMEFCAAGFQQGKVINVAQFSLSHA